MERICIACKYFTALADYTPGYSMRVECQQLHWDMEPNAGEAAERFFRFNMLAITCPDFEPSDIAKKHGWEYKDLKICN